MDYVNDMSVHIQVEALTHSSAYNTGMCLAEFGGHVTAEELHFPEDLLSEKPSSNDTREGVKSFLTCLVTPHEPVEDEEKEERNHCIFRTTARHRRRKDETDAGGGYCIA